MIFYIYKIEYINVLTGERFTYIGSTKDLHKRELKHKSSSNNEKFNCKLYQTIRTQGGWVNFKMTEIQRMDCNDEERRIRENELITDFNANMNTNRAYLSPAMKHFLHEKEKKTRKMCSCGTTFLSKNGWLHKKSEKHKKLLQKIEMNL